MEIPHKTVLDDITDEQRELLRKFRESLDVELNHRHTDQLLVKFLRAKNYNLNEARKVFLVNYYSRITFGIDNILETYKKPEVAEKFETTAVLGFAKDSTLIRYTAAGHLDFYGFIMSMTCTEICLYLSYIIEQDIQTLEEESLKTGKNVTEITYVVDLEGFTLQKVLHKNVVEMGLDLMHLLQDCYPEIWRKIIVINASKIFKTAFNLFKPVLRNVIREKLIILDKAHSKNVLLQYIDEDVLPAFLGGNKVDSRGDPMCKEFVTFGGTVSEKFYSQYKHTLLSVDDPEVRVVSIGARSVFNAISVVREVGSKLRLQTRSESGSIATALFYRDFEPDTDHLDLPEEFECVQENPKYKQISVELRIQMHCTQEDCTIMTFRPGIYVIRFNNSSSWFTSRKVYYKLTVTPPQSTISS